MNNVVLLHLFSCCFRVKGYFFFCFIWLTVVMCLIYSRAGLHAIINTLIFTTGLLQKTGLSHGLQQKRKELWAQGFQGFDWESLFTLPSQLLMPEVAHLERRGMRSCSLPRL